MIENFGIGIDIVNVTRFKKISYRSKPGFYKKIFLPSEIKYCLRYKNSYEHFAGKFAIKEAVIKSVDGKLSLLKIMTSHSNSKPKVKILDRNFKKFAFVVSISHDENYAIGVVISQRS